MASERPPEGKDAGEWQVATDPGGSARPARDVSSIGHALCCPRWTWKGKSAPPRPAPSIMCARECGSGSAPARPRAISSICLASACAPASRVVGGSDLGGNREAGRRARHSAHHAGRNPRARPDDRRRRRDRARPEPDQGRRRSLLREKIVASASAAMVVIADAVEMGPGARPLSAAGRGGAVRLCGDACARSRPKPRMPAPRSRAAAQRTKDGHAFVTDSGHLDPRCRARADCRAGASWPSGSPQSPAWSSTACSLASPKRLSLPGPDGVRTVERP